MVDDANPRQNATNTGQTDPGIAYDAFAEFGECLRGALLHIHSPGYVAPDLLLKVAGCGMADGPAALQRCLLAGIADLEPGREAPHSNRLRRAYASLHDRFVLGLTQEESAERLSVSVRHLQRIQTDAIHLLARHLWERWQVAKGMQGREARDSAAGQAGGGQAGDWQGQADRELASLAACAPSQTADVCAIVQGVLELERSVIERRGISVEPPRLPTDLIAATHPAALRQALIVAVGRLSQGISEGVISLSATLDGNSIVVTLSAPIGDGQYCADEELVGDLILPTGVSAAVRRGSRQICIELRLPAQSHRAILVVEDNHDMVVFYRHCTAGLPYRIVHEEPGDGIVNRIEAAAPDVVVLDVMMPHMDGWQILTYLRAMPATREIPVIVCSVVKEQDLARLLGAAQFLSKPVQPRQFIQALDQVLRPQQR